ncbi:pyridoxamine 5'-phosphate oxidase family protein [Shimia sp. R9_1]|uniref:pyridoxamine 5'-phosphate oxidase family protein n=1 Tax=Shimia sp. R9_1 TaxID=2821111 RepID=UPI001AD98DBD|nr:pyridoxamine 5'-phosphate oxidase family protein [Shimia sp. R9_1]MBO9406386.1 pyridoxamine 5'-phosphate oxidase family protein [Shimia sp. R9_1]
MEYVTDIAELEALYGTPGSASLHKVAHQMTPLYRKWIMASRFCVLSTVGPNGTDGSPRGDDGPVVRELDAQTLLMPDWRGNNRIDTLRNIVADGRISLMFMVPGSNNVVRINGLAKVTTDQELRESFEVKGQHPRSVIVIKIGEIYSQCARAVMRAGLWSAGDESAQLPTVGEILAEQTRGAEGGQSYDDGWAARAAKTMW